MPTATLTTRQFIEQYIETISAQPKTEELMDRFISDPALKHHIREAEAAFPGYGFEVHQLVVEGDTAALRATMHGTHLGVFAGMSPTGREVTADLMVFYRIEDGRIAQYWMQFDSMSLMAQLAT